MKLLPDNMQMFSLPDSTPKVCNDDLTAAETEIKEYESLLYKIATSFGFMDSETINLVQQVCSRFNEFFDDRQDSTSLKIRLSKVMVHKCIFKISSQLFSQNIKTEKIRVTNMPLSLHSVFILHDIIGFNEWEIAEMLNINLQQVKQRLNKALLFIDKHQY